MQRMDTIVEMLSERRAGSKLKNISINHSKDSPISTMRFTFEDTNDVERSVIVWGKDLGVGFGSQKLKE